MKKIKFGAFLALTASVMLTSLVCGDDSKKKNADTPIDTSVTFSITDNLFDSTKTDTLGLSKADGTELISVFSATDTTDHYCNGVALIAFKNKLYIQWQSSATDEDSADSWVAYSSSTDGKTWNTPKHLEVNSDGSAYNPGYARTSGGWWTDGNTLVAYINSWPNYSPRGGDVYYRTSTDGETWSEAKRLTDKNGNAINGIFEQDPHALPSGRILNAVHEQTGAGLGGLYLHPYYTDDPTGITGWTRGTMTNIATVSTVLNMSAELEPSSYYRTDGGIVMVFRDQNGSYMKLGSVSADNGATWTTPAVTNFPDSRCKQSAGNLPNGTAFQVSDPSGGANGSKKRYPLALTLSKDGKVFDKAFLLRGQSEFSATVRYSGKAKSLGYSYPKSTIWNGYLYVGYSVNKEDIHVSRIPLSSLVY
jgi:hypothetical protein